MKLTGIIIVLLVTASILFTATEAMAGRGSVKHSSKKGTQTSAAGKSAGTRTTAKTGSNTATRTTTTRTTTTAKSTTTARATTAHRPATQPSNRQSARAGYRAGSRHGYQAVDNGRRHRNHVLLRQWCLLCIFGHRLRGHITTAWSRSLRRAHLHDGGLRGIDTILLRQWRVLRGDRCSRTTTTSSRATGSGANHTSGDNYHCEQRFCSCRG